MEQETPGTGNVDLGMILSIIKDLASSIVIIQVRAERDQHTPARRTRSAAPLRRHQK